MWTVLVVEDEADLRLLVELTIEYDDHLEVAGIASNASEAMAMAEALRPDLVILDHWLGGPLTGIDVAARVRAISPTTRTILFSAADDVIDLSDSHIDVVVAKSDLASLPAIAHKLLATPV